MATYTLLINSLYTQSGDDVYAKPLDGNFSGTNWTDDNVAAVEVADTNVYEIVLDETKGYVVYLNSHSQSFAANAGTDTITAAGHGLQNGETVRFKGADLPAPLTQSTVYFVRDRSTDTFRVATTSNGSAIDFTDAGSGTMRFIAASKRSKAGDDKIGTVPQSKDTSLTPEGEESLVAAIVASTLGDDARLARQFNFNRRDIEKLSPTQWRYTVYEDDASTVAYVVDFNPTNGAKAVVS
jgi:hypothetical protein